MSDNNKSIEIRIVNVLNAYNANLFSSIHAAALAYNVNPRRFKNVIKAKTHCLTVSQMADC